MRRNWRCRNCGMLLGIVDGGRLHIRLAKGYQYAVGLPANTICRKCRTLNELRKGDPRVWSAR